MAHTKSGQGHCLVQCKQHSNGCEVGGIRTGDAAWLRKKTDVNHVNVAKLEELMKGINLALKLDSATVSAWVESVIMKESRTETKGVAEVLVKQQL